jgi:hypothetical protein
LELNDPRAIRRAYDAAHKPPPSMDEERPAGSQRRPQARSHDPLDIIQMFRAGAIPPTFRSPSLQRRWPRR